MINVNKIADLFLEVLNSYPSLSMNLDKHFWRKKNESNYEGILLQFVDLFGFEINSLTMIEFNSQITEDENFYYFGMFETDDLVINKKNKRVQMIDYYKNLIVECAIDEISFIHAIFEYFRIPANFYEFTNEEDKEFAKKRILKCTQLAGGENFKQFYVNDL